MLKAIDKPREELSKYAPKMTTLYIDPEKIRDVIGSGGKVIQKIVADTGAKIDIEDSAPPWTIPRWAPSTWARSRG